MADTKELDTNTAVKAVKQVEFWMGDHNLPRDRFLREKVAADPEGWIDLSVIMSFNRMKSITTNAAGVSDALRTSREIVVSEDGKRIRRAKPIPESLNFRESTIYAKGLPKDATIEELEEAFSACGKVCRVAMRKYVDDAGVEGFKGSIFVEYETPEQAQAACKGPITVRGAIVPKVIPKTEYFAAQTMERQAQRAQQATVAEAKAAEDAKDNEANEFKKVQVTPGVLLLIDNLGDISSREVQDVLTKYAPPRFLDMTVGDPKAIARFETAEMAKAAYDGLVNDKVRIGNRDPILRILEGDEEKEYWAKVEAFHYKKWLARQHRTARGGGRGGRGGRGRGGRGGRH